MSSQKPKSVYAASKRQHTAAGRQIQAILTGNHTWPQTEQRAQIGEAIRYVRYNIPCSWNGAFKHSQYFRF